MQACRDRGGPALLGRLRLSCNLPEEKRGMAGCGCVAKRLRAGTRALKQCNRGNSGNAGNRKLRVHCELPARASFLACTKPRALGGTQTIVRWLTAHIEKLRPAIRR